jgi:hypothetical protein
MGKQIQCGSSGRRGSRSGAVVVADEEAAPVRSASSTRLKLQRGGLWWSRRAVCRNIGAGRRRGERRERWRGKVRGGGGTR